MRTFKQGWYLVYTRPQHERKVHSRLTELDIVSFLPVKKTIRTWRDRKKIIDMPLFPSYVFLYLTDMNAFYNGMDIDGVLYYIKNGKEIAQVDEAVINNIRLLTSEPKGIEISHCSFRPGQKVIINKGPLTGLTCEVIQTEHKTKLLVRIDLLKRNILLNMPQESLIQA